MVNHFHNISRCQLPPLLRSGFFCISLSITEQIISFSKCFYEILLFSFVFVCFKIFIIDSLLFLDVFKSSFVIQGCWSVLFLIFFFSIFGKAFWYWFLKKRRKTSYTLSVSLHSFKSCQSTCNNKLWNSKIGVLFSFENYFIFLITISFSFVIIWYNKNWKMITNISINDATISCNIIKFISKNIFDQCFTRPTILNWF